MVLDTQDKDIMGIFCCSVSPLSQWTCLDLKAIWFPCFIPHIFMQIPPSLLNCLNSQIKIFLQWMPPLRSLEGTDLLPSIETNVEYVTKTYFSYSFWLCLNPQEYGPLLIYFYISGTSYLPMTWKVINK